MALSREHATCIIGRIYLVDSRRRMPTSFLFESLEYLFYKNTMIQYPSCDALVLPSLRCDRERGAHGKRSSHLVAAYNALLDTSCRTLPI
jgi:hypothetical protein